MNEMFLLKLGEIVLKGGNRFQFENRLKTNIRRRMRPYGEFRVYIVQSTVYIEPEEEACDLEGAWEACHYIFGVVSLCRCRPCEKALDDIFRAAMEYLGDDLRCAATFKVESKRSDKRFPLTSIAISQEIGGRIAEAVPTLAVDVRHPEYTVYVEVRDHAAYVHGPAEPGAGGLPTGVGGRAMVLLSGGIDSPVAGYMIAKRGVELEAVHFESFPYTSERAREKVFDLARIMSQYTGSINLHVVSLTHIQELLVKNCEEDYFTLILRRYMMTIADRIAHRTGCGGLVTGESLGQVASQTMQALGVTDPAATLPVFRPCIGLDKEEIIRIARKIGTFETSIQPYEDCCTVFTPKHPKTRPELDRVLEQQGRLDFEALVEEAVAGAYVQRIRIEF